MCVCPSFRRTGRDGSFARKRETLAGRSGLQTLRGPRCGSRSSAGTDGATLGKSEGTAVAVVSSLAESVDRTRVADGGTLGRVGCLADGAGRRTGESLRSAPGRNRGRAACGRRCPLRSREAGQSEAGRDRAQAARERRVRGGRERRHRRDVADEPPWCGPRAPSIATARPRSAARLRSSRGAARHPRCQRAGRPSGDDARSSA